MKLLLDFGNSRCKWANLDGKAIHLGGSIDYYQDEPLDCITKLIQALPLPDVREIHSISVLGSTFDQAFEQALSIQSSTSVTFYQSTLNAYGISLGYNDATQYGADRYAALVGASHRGEGAKIIIDIGTAITIDTIDAAGKHFGGLIFPGVHLMRSALMKNTQGINVDINVKPKSGFAQSTQDAVDTGTILCIQHAVQGIVSQLKSHIDKSAAVLITGGDADILLVDNNDYIACPDLVFEGLAIMQES